MDTNPTIVTVTLNPAIDRTLSIDHFAAGKVNRVVADQMHAAGKGVNVAAALADLGVPVIATGFLGQENADPFEQLFLDKKIEDHCVRVPGRTRTGLKIVNRIDGVTTDINFPGLQVDGAAIEQLTQQIEEMVIEGRWFALCGSVPAGIDAGIYGKLIYIIQSAGGQVLLDTSGPPLAPALAARPQIVKPNLAELSELAGRSIETPLDVVATARAFFIDRGVKLAVVSMGGDGAVFVAQDRALLAAPPKVIVKSTVGAGDAMVAGILLGMSRRQSLEQIASLASSLGTFAVTRIGSGIATPEAIKSFAPRITSLQT